MRSLFLILCLFVSSIYAENISKEKALDIANQFFKTNSKVRRNFSLQCVDVEGRASDKLPSFYIFNDTQKDGFVIVAGDDRVVPILGYSFENNFPQTNLPCNVEMWLEEISAQIVYASRNNILYPEDDEKDVGEVIIHLDTPLWDQGEPYNDLCPILGREKTPSGCVMTATAIVMRHHQWPQKGIGVIPGYTTDTYGYTFPERKLGHIYQWENMPYKYETYTSEQADNVATLMFDLGMMLEADYAPEGTGALISQIPSVLQTYMDYDKSVREYYRNEFSDDVWNQLLQNELDNNRPIIYGGFDKNLSGGHAFVLDGYTTNNYYSVNWGWGGLYNGYFLLSALKPTGQGTGGNGSNFNYHQSAVVGIKKKEGMTDRLEFVSRKDGLNGLYSSSVSFAVNAPFTISAGVITNLSSSDFSGILMLGLTDCTGVIKEELVSQHIVDLKTNQGYTFSNVQCVITKEIDKGDRIKAFYKSERTKEWTLIKGDEICVYELLVADEFTIDESTNVIYNKEQQRLHIKTKKGVQVVFIKEDGLDCNYFCNATNDGVEIFTKELEKGAYILKLSKGNEYRELKILMGNSKSE